MKRDTLLDYFDERLRGDTEFLVHDDGYRVRRQSYDEVRRAAAAFAARLAGAGVGAGDAVLFWGENRPEWIAAFWGCLLRGAVVVPIDYRASSAFLESIARRVDARLLLVGDDVAPARPAGVETWRFAELREAGGGGPAGPVGPETGGRPAHPPADAAGEAAPDAPHAQRDTGAAEHDPHATGEAAPGAPRAQRDTGAAEHDPDAAGHDPDAGGGAAPAAPHAPAPGDTAEIVFTSGATSEPKGVVITHRNVLANIVPVEREVLKYRRYARPFRPLRFLDLLPLSHMFGQALATFIPPMLPGTCVFMKGYSPPAIVRQIRTRRISVLVCVPKILDVLKDHVVQAAPETAEPAEGLGVAHRWWRYRRVHRLFGMKFWCFIVGAAPLDPALEAFWQRLGFLVVQGYGLTETAPIVTLNHPFRTRRGSVGKPIAGMQVRIADDGEILVKGDNVTTGYFGGTAEDDAVFEDGWFHTGDLGVLDDAGRLQVHGRKKEMIVTAEGLNVFPEDVERVVDAVPGVEESAVVGLTRDGGERVYAVAVLAAGTPPGDVARAANRELADHQKVRGVLAWPGDRLPRTEGTRKLMRRAVKTWAEEGGVPAPAAAAGGGRSVASILARISGGAVDGGTRLDELGLSSLERVELLMTLESELDAAVDEGGVAGAATVADLETLVARSADAPRPAPAPFPAPRWNQAWAVRHLRRAALAVWLLPMTRLFAWIRVEGLEHVRALDGPVVFAANHQSFIDPSVILAALPRRQRHRVVTAMSKEFFAGHFDPANHTRLRRFTSSLNYYLAAGFYNAFPLPQREAGARDALRYAGELVSAGNSLLIFPEGLRVTGEAVARFQPGATMLAARLDVPVVPVRLRGVDRVMGRGHRMARPGRVGVRFGPPRRLTGSDYAAMAADLEAAVKAL